MAQNYKETLNLPRTDFPMKANLAQRGPELLRVWSAMRVDEQIQKAREDAELFVLHGWQGVGRLNRRQIGHIYGVPKSGKLKGA